jgi:hypothetical protein
LEPIKSSFFWDATPRSPTKANRIFGGYVSFVAKDEEYAEDKTSSCLIHAGFLLRLIFNPEDRGEMFL